MSQSMCKYAVLLIAAIALSSLGTGCGSGGGGSDGGGEGRAVAGCLNPAEVREEIDHIAEGAETSSEEIEAKQEAIRAAEAEAC